MKFFSSSNKALLFAAVSGLIIVIAESMTLSMPGFADDARATPDILKSSIDALFFVLYLAYLYGFIVVARRLNTRTLKIAAMLLMVFSGAALVTSHFFLPTTGQPNGYIIFLGLGLATCVGTLGVVVWRQHSRLGAMAKWYGFFAVVSATGFSLIFGNPVAAVLPDLAAYMAGSLIFLKLVRKD